MYRVIKAFVDLQDSNFAYSVGDEFPRKGLNVLQSRINELASANNRQGSPLIEEVEEPVKKKRTTKTEE
jgi:hypothetical protein